MSEQEVGEESLLLKEQTAALAAISEVLRARDESVRRGDYKIMGQLARAETPRGVFQFPHCTGPTVAFVAERATNGQLAMVSDNKLVIITAWNGLPTIRKNTERQCSACMTDCDVCGTDGKKNCEAYKCGGAGKVPVEVPCECTASGTVRPLNDCPDCQGSGHIKELKTCTVCEGTGRMTCSVCHGTRKVSTGNTGGSRNWKTSKCPACNGTRFEGEDALQREQDFMNARLGPMIFLGPILKFAVDSVGGTGEPPTVFTVDPDTSGNYLVLLVEHDFGTIPAPSLFNCNKHGDGWEEKCDHCRYVAEAIIANPARGAYLIGGVLKSASRGA